MDGTVKIWAPMENPQPNAILETAPNYSHPSTSENGQVRKLCTAACSSTCVMVGPVSWAKQTAHMYAAPLHCQDYTSNTISKVFAKLIIVCLFRLFPDMQLFNNTKYLIPVMSMAAFTIAISH